jgi:hypothetical protein
MISKYEPGLIAADYATLFRRISKPALQMTIQENEVTVAVDSTGIKVTNRGDWIREKHGKTRKRWPKVHGSAAVKSKKLLSIEITEDSY